MNKCVLLVLTASLTYGSECKRAIEKTETASVYANKTENDSLAAQKTEKQEATITVDSNGKEFLETF